MDKILLINKPKGWTSHDVVAKLRGVLGIKKIGHAGTLDPLATGLLIILVGKKTKEADNFLKLDKEYIAEIKLGAVSNTYDGEGTIAVKSSKAKVARAHIEKVIEKFVGEVLQTPPIFSAIKIKGQPAYKLARKGKEVKLKPRKIKIYDIEILDYCWPDLKIKVKCGSGTYIRSLANDIGQALGTGGYLFALTRTKIGEFDLKDSKNIEEIKTQS